MRRDCRARFQQRQPRIYNAAVRRGADRPQQRHRRREGGLLRYVLKARGDEGSSDQLPPK